MLAIEAREQSRINRDSIHRRKVDELWSQLTDCIDDAIERGDFQTEIETNAVGKPLDEIIARLKAAKFDVDAQPINLNYLALDFRPDAAYKVWIGWADDECAASKGLPIGEKAKMKAKPTRKPAKKSAPKI